MNLYNKKSMSLMVLVITICIIIIFSSTVIILYKKTDIISEASKAQFLSDFKNYEDELSIYINNQENENVRGYNAKYLNADTGKVVYKSSTYENENIYNVIPSLKNAKNSKDFKIENGKLLYVGSDIKKSEWLNYINNDTQNADVENFQINLSAPSQEDITSSGIYEKYDLKITSINDLSNIDVSTNLCVIDQNNSVVNNVNIKIDNSVIQSKDAEYIISVDTSNLSNGSYKLKINNNCIKDIYNNSNNADIFSQKSFNVKISKLLESPSIELNTQDVSQKVLVSITSNVNNATIMYSIGNQVDWKQYNQSFEITNNTIIYSKIVQSNNYSNVVSKEITNIDNLGPNIYISNPSKSVANSADSIYYEIDYYDENLKEAYLNSSFITLNKTDTADAKIIMTNIDKNKYKVELYNITGKGKIGLSINEKSAVDIAGNYSNKIDSASFDVDTNIPAMPIISLDNASWTNVSVKATIIYDKESIQNEYSFDGINWNIYKESLSITDNCVIYAKAIDSASNVSNISTCTITNIDKIVPTISCSINGGIYNSDVTTHVIVSDDNSGVNTNSLQYAISDKNGTVPTSGWNSFQNDSDINLNTSYQSYYLYIKAKDNATNEAVYTSNIFNVQKSRGITLINPEKAYVNSSNQVIYKVVYDRSIYSIINLNSSYIKINNNNSDVNPQVSVYQESDSTWDISLNNLKGNGKISISILSGSAKDKNGILTNEITNFESVIVDNIKPTITISKPSKSIVSSKDSVSYTITYNDENFDYIALNINNIGVNKVGSANYSNIDITGDNNIRIVTFTGLTGDGKISFNIAYGTGYDKAGNVTEYYGYSDSFEVDNTNPTIKIGNPSKTDAKQNDEVSFNVEFSDKNLDLITMNLDNIILYKTGTANADIVINDTDKSNIKKVKLTNIIGQGKLAIAIDKGVAKDSTGNFNETTDLSEYVNVDAQGPIITISSPSIKYVNSSKVVTYQISLADENFKEANLNQNSIILNKTNTANASINVYGYANSWTVQLSNITGDGTISIKIKEGVAIDKSSNYSLASDFSEEIIVDNTIPKITISDPSKLVAYTGDSFSYTITYDDDNFYNTTLTKDNISFNKYGNNVNGNLDIITNGKEQIVNISDIRGSGTISISIPYEVASDLSGNVSQYYGPSKSVEILPYIQNSEYLVKSITSSKYLVDILEAVSSESTLVYSFTGNNDWQKYSSTITAESKSTIYSAIKDNYGNYSNIKTLTIE